MQAPPQRVRHETFDFAFLVLTALFVAALVVCNIIAPKFVALDLGIYTFEVSAGILPYPLTFLVTDVLSEVYGRRRAQQVVGAGFVASVFTLVVLWLGSVPPALEQSPIDDGTYLHVFGFAPLAITGSMVAYLVAQSLDVQLFHFWKRLTRGRHLWLRNNASTITSQLVDTAIVTTLVFSPKLLDGAVDFAFVLALIGHGWLFKVLCAALDTPLIYAAVWWLGSHPHDDD